MFLPVLIFANAEVLIFSLDLFLQVEDFTWKYTKKSETVFSFCILCVILFFLFVKPKKLQNFIHVKLLCEETGSV